MNLVVKKLTITCFLIFLFFFGSGIQLPAKEINVSASDLLKKVKENYASHKSYWDIGTVEQSTASRKFKTYFVRPNQFLFKWVEHLKISSPLNRPGYYAIWSNNTGAYSYYRYQSDLTDGVEKEENIGMAVAGATGISGGSAHNIPNLMINDVGGWETTNLANPKLAEDEIIDGINCYHIIGNHPNNSQNKYELWVTKNDFLIKKIKDSSPLGDTITTYDKIAVNEAIQPSVFDFEKNIRNPIKKLKETSILEKISSKAAKLSAYLRARKIKPKSDTYEFVTTTKITTKNYKNAIFESNVHWVIVDPFLYEIELSSSTLAQQRIEDILYGAMNYKFAFKITEENVGKQIDPEDLAMVKSKCNETIKEYKLGIELTNLKSDYVSVAEISKN